MKYVAKQVDASVNLPDRHPLVDMTWLLSGVILIFVVLYFSGGVIIDQLARHIPPEYDNSISPGFTAQLLAQFGPEITEGEVFDDTQALFAQLRKLLPEDDTREYRLTLVDTDKVNALALPGGQIVVFRALLDKAESQNEVAMVLAHEFGHISHRHHWRRIGRAVLFGVTATFLGSQSTLQNQITNIPLATMMQANSRSHETESDSFAIDLVCRHYGHSGGATAFFARNLGEEDNTNDTISFLLTHPLSQERIDNIEARAEERNCSPGDTSQWPYTKT